MCWFAWAPIGKCANINLNMLSIPCRLFPDTHGCRSLSPSGFPTGRGVTMETDMMSAQWHCWLLKDEVSLSLDHTVCICSVFGLRVSECVCVCVEQVHAQWRSNEQIDCLFKHLYGEMNWAWYQRWERVTNQTIISLCLRICFCINKCACVWMHIKVS